MRSRKRRIIGHRLNATLLFTISIVPLISRLKLLGLLSSVEHLLLASESVGNKDQSHYLIELNRPTSELLATVGITYPDL